MNEGCNFTRNIFYSGECLAGIHLLANNPASAANIPLEHPTQRTIQWNEWVTITKY